MVELDTGRLKTSDIRFYLGYSGWGQGQLDKELEEDSWIVCDFVTDELLFDTEPTVDLEKSLGKHGWKIFCIFKLPCRPTAELKPFLSKFTLSAKKWNIEHGNGTRKNSRAGTCARGRSG